MLDHLLPPLDETRLTVREAAETLGTSTQTIYRAIESGALQHWRVAPGTIVLTREGLERYLEQLQQRPRHRVRTADDGPRARPQGARRTAMRAELARRGIAT